MIARRFLALGMLLVTGFVPLRGLAASPTTLPADVKITTNSAAVKPAVQAFLAAHLTNLASADPTAVKAAREAIIAEVTSTGINAPKPSEPFLEAYADALSQGVKPLAKHADVRVRLNAAIVSARVAERANNDRLSPAVMEFLNDSNEAVVLWAVKACKFLIPPLLRTADLKKDVPLFTAFSTTIKNNVKSGPIVQAGYDALRIDQLSPAFPPAKWDAAAQATVSIAQDLMAKRLEQYKQGVPELAVGESSATTFLCVEKVWKAQTPAQQLKSVQLISDLIGVASQRAPSAGGVALLDLAGIIKKAGDALSVVGKLTATDTDMDKAVKDVRTVSPTTPAPEMLNRARAMYASLVKIKQFSSIKPPPSL